MDAWAKSKYVADPDEEESAKEKPGKRWRKSGSDALKFVEAKCQVDADVKKEGVALRQQELALRNRSGKRNLKPKCIFSGSNCGNKQFINNSSLTISNNNFNKLEI